MHTDMLADLTADEIGEVSPYSGVGESWMDSRYQSFWFPLQSCSLYLNDHCHLYNIMRRRMYFLQIWREYHKDKDAVCAIIPVSHMTQPLKSVAIKTLIDPVQSQ